GLLFISPVTGTVASALGCARPIRTLGGSSGRSRGSCTPRPRPAAATPAKTVPGQVDRSQLPNRSDLTEPALPAAALPAASCPVVGPVAGGPRGGRRPPLVDGARAGRTPAGRTGCPPRSGRGAASRWPRRLGERRLARARGGTVALRRFG